MTMAASFLRAITDRDRRGVGRLSMEGWIPIDISASLPYSPKRDPSMDKDLRGV